MTNVRARSGDGILLAAVCMASVLGAGSATMVNVALPRIGTDLAVGFSGLQWIANVFTVLLASLMLPAATLGTNLGRRRMFCAGLGLVGLGSAAAAAAPNLGVLLAARAVQAVGAAIAGPTSLGIIAHQYTDAGPRARAIGLWAASAGIGLAIGPLVAGSLLGAVSWRGVFLIVAAVAFADGVVAWLVIPEARHGRPLKRGGVDGVGALVIALTLAAFSFGCIEGDKYGWASPRIVGALVLSVAGAVAFLRLERRRGSAARAVLMPLAVWRSRAFIAANVGGAVFFFALYGLLFLYSVYCQHQLHFSPLRTGVVFLPMTATMAVLAVLAGWILRRTGVLPAAVGGFALATAGAVSLAVNPGSAPGAVGLALRFSLLGLGFGLVSAPLTVTAVSALQGSGTTLASSVYNAARQVGAVIGVAVLGAIAPVGAGSSTARLDASVLLVAGLLAASGAMLSRLLTTSGPALVAQTIAPARVEGKV